MSQTQELKESNEPKESKESKEPTIEKLRIRLIHGKKRKLRIWDTNMKWKHVQESVINTFPTLQTQNKHMFWHLEYDSSTWIEDEEDWQIYLKFYATLQSKNKSKFIENGTLSNELELYIVAGDDTIAQDLIKNDNRLINNNINNVNNNNNDQNDNNEPPKKKMRMDEDEAKSQVNKNPFLQTTDFNIHLDQQIQIPLQTQNKLNEYNLPIWNNGDRDTWLWECVKKLLLKQKNNGNKRGLTVLAIRAEIAKLANCEKPTVKELNRILYKNIGKGYLTKFQPDPRKKPFWSINA